jgi:hypothetical protein
VARSEIDDPKLRHVETKLGFIEPKLRNVETKLGLIETKIRNVETKLRSIETKLGFIEPKLRNVETKLGFVDPRRLPTRRRRGVITRNSRQDNQIRLGAALTGPAGLVAKQSEDRPWADRSSTCNRRFWRPSRASQAVLEIDHARSTSRSAAARRGGRPARG